MNKDRILRSVSKRDGWNCHLCSMLLNKDNVTLDHLLPRKYGGTYALSNIKLACGKCNHERSSEPLEYFRMKKMFLSSFPQFNSELQIYTYLKRAIELTRNKPRINTRKYKNRLQFKMRLNDEMK